MPKLALFELGGRHLALPIEGIRKILPACRIFPLPLLPEAYAGVFLFDGEIVPILELCGPLGSGLCEEPPEPLHTIVFTTEYGTVGMPAGVVQRIVEQDQGSLEEPTGEENVPGCRQVFACGQVRHLLLDMENLVRTGP